MVRSIYIILLAVISLSFTQCVIDSSPGPRGLDGRAYFGIDFDDYAPYSYWDNNNSIPHNPIIGQYYNTRPGRYRFEYFVNPTDYWHGTYEIWTNQGEPGQPYGEAGRDGLDSYLMLIVNESGPYEFRPQHGIASDKRTIEFKDTKFHYKIHMQKSSTLLRSAEKPKFVREGKGAE